MATRTATETRSHAWLLPLIAISLRFFLIMVGNGIGWVIFTLQEHPSPWEQALLWGNVHVSLIADVGTIGFLVWAVQREGLRLRDLFGWERTRVGRDILIGLGTALVLFVALFAGNILGAFIAFGPDAFTPTSFELDPSTLPPLWYYLWALIVLPLTVAPAEEMLYRGYAQERFEALTGSKWKALLIVAVGFGFQHVAFSLTSPQAALARFVGTLLTGLVFGLLYMKQRRLLPLIIGHWLVNFVGLGLLPLLGYLSMT